MTHLLKFQSVHMRDEQSEGYEHDIVPYDGKLDAVHGIDDCMSERSRDFMTVLGQCFVRGQEVSFLNSSL